MQTIKVYPNPAVNEMMIDLINTVISDIKVYSVAGQEFSMDFCNNKVDVSSLPSGMYILVVTDKSGMRYQACFVKE